MGSVFWQFSKPIESSTGLINRHRFLKSIHMSCRFFEFVKLAPKNGPNGPDQLSSSCCYIFVQNDLNLSMNICWNRCQIRAPWPQLPLDWHQALPIWVKLKPWPPNCYLLRGHFMFEVVRSLIVTRCCFETLKVMLQRLLY